MSEGRKRKVHSPEFKAKVGLEALKGVKTINEIVQEYGVHPVQVGQWKKAIQEQAKRLFGKTGDRPRFPVLDQSSAAAAPTFQECHWPRSSGMTPSPPESSSQCTDRVILRHARGIHHLCAVLRNR
jgi:transposase-like protein